MHKNSISSQQSMTFSFHRAGRYTNDMTKANFVTSWARTSVLQMKWMIWISAFLIVNQGAVGEEGQPMISQFHKTVKRKKKNRKSEHDL